MASFKDFHDKNTKIAENEFNKLGELPAVLTAQRENGSIFCCFKSFDNEDEKNFTFTVYKTLIVLENVMRYSFACEAWFIKSHDDKLLTKPSQHSDRRECLQIVSANKNGRVLSDMFFIERSETDTLLIKEKPDNFKDVKGVVANLFHLANQNKPIPQQYYDDYQKIAKPDWFREIV